MKKKLIYAFFCLMMILFYYFNKTINFNEELPVEINREQIIFGAIRAYHPDLLYMKYRLEFAKSNNIFKKKVDYETDVMAEKYFYYFKGIVKIVESDKLILKKDRAQTFLKFRANAGKEYLLTISGDHEGSANDRTILVRLYKYDETKLDLIFNRTEIYSVDPGLDANYFTERLKFYLYKYVIRDKRYTGTSDT